MKHITQPTFFHQRFALQSHHDSRQLLFRAIRRRIRSGPTFDTVSTLGHNRRHAAIACMHLPCQFGWHSRTNDNRILRRVARHGDKLSSIQNVFSTSFVRSCIHQPDLNMRCARVFSCECVAEKLTRFIAWHVV